MHFLNNLKLKYKLIISYFVLIVIPLIIFSRLSFKEFAQILENRIIYSAEQSFNQGTEYVTYKIHKIIEVSDNIVVNGYVKKILERDLNLTSVLQMHEDLNNLRSLLYSYKNDKDIYNICIYINDDLPHDDNDDDIASISYATKQKWFSQLPGAGSRVFMVPPAFYTNPNQHENMVLSVARRITCSTNYIDIIGYLRIDFLERNIRDILINANAIDGSLTYIRSRDDRIVSTTDNELLDKYRLSLADMERLQVAKDWTIISVNNEDCYARVKNIDDTDWTIITVIPLNDIYREVANISRLMFVFLVIIIPITILFSVLLTYQLTRRLSNLSKKMKYVTENVFEEYKEKYDYNDEIGELTSSYNYMVKHISTLAEEKYKSGLSIKSTELELLQSQINPHFLYNTMDMINWMSYDNRGEEIRKITRALSTFYKISLSKGKTMIPLRDELKHVELYMEIQNLRLNNNIDFVIDCPKHLKDILIPKITLQPIVENSVFHGILNKEDKRGSIHIVCRDDDTYLSILIKDNGIGMDEGTKKQLLDNDEKKGFGLRNIETRLMLTYNNKSSFEVNSKIDLGTTIEIKIPLF